VARDRQRAKQRKQRREPSPPSREGRERDRLTPDSQPLHRENVPGPFEHGGEVDEFEAALVAGADGRPEDDPDAAERASLGEETPAAEREDDDRAAAAAATGRTPTPAEDARGRGGSRSLNFLRACWAELQRVQWPDRRQVGQATAVVLGFVLIAGAFLGLADFVAERVVDLII
jgi:preprotein translocase subunit SecE